MARSDLVLNLVETGIKGDISRFKMTAEAIVADATAKHHHHFADKIRVLLTESDKAIANHQIHASSSRQIAQDVFYELITEKTLDDLVLPNDVLEQCQELLEEHSRRDMLRSFNMEPRHRILLAGAPGNGKTSLAEAMANELMLPFYLVRYEGIFSKYLGETAQKLDDLFEHVKTRRCVLFFDEFDAIGKERADELDNGEVKRVVNSLLKQIDMLPSHVVVIAATNHQKMLDSAIWRRFQMQLKLPTPSQVLISNWLDAFEERVQIAFGMPTKDIATSLKGLSFAEIEDFALDVRRKYVLGLPASEKKLSQITKGILNNWVKKMHLRES